MRRAAIPFSEAAIIRLPVRVNVSNGRFLLVEPGADVFDNPPNVFISRNLTVEIY